MATVIWKGGMAIVVGALAACGGNQRPPVIEEYTGVSWISPGAVMSTISSDAAYRSAYILLDAGSNRDVAIGGNRHAGQFCPEPPPDAAQSVSAAVTAALKANATLPATAGGVSGGLDGNYGEALATAVAPMIERTQGLQFYRDQAFHACVAYLNGVIGQEQYKNELVRSADIAAQVIMLEIVETTGPNGEPGDLATVEADLKKAVEALAPIRAILRQLTPPATAAES